jgi:N-acetylmuramate 1-kinase
MALIPSIKTDVLLRETRIRFPAFGEAQVRIAPIEKGGSGRKFYRLQCGPDMSIILVKYDLERDENRVYVQIAEFLAAHHIRAPKIYFHDAAEGLIWLEDLGETDLWMQRGESWLVRRAFYESALEEAAKLHRLPATAAGEISGQLAPEFNAALYQWEQSYFFENCLGLYFGVAENVRTELAALPTLHEIAQRLGDLPRVLVHRDLQSQNILVRNGHAHLIDFQGMRPGLAEYDLASLLYDPYVELAEAEREELLTFYGNLRDDEDETARPEIERRQILRLCAMQRLMQALGAYGFLGLVKGSRAFLEYVEPARCSLCALLGEIGGLEPLENLLGVLPANRRGE